jgi:LCP family protein required for cell wall assembly
MCAGEVKPVEDPGTRKRPAGNRETFDPEATDPGRGMRPAVPEVTWDPDDDAPWLPASPRRRRAGKVLMISLAALVLIIAGTGTAAYLVARHDLGAMHRIGNPFASIPGSSRAPAPTGPAAQDVTFLVGGLQAQPPVPATGTNAASSQSSRSDTLMLVHLIAGGRGAYVVSIPPNSRVPIPGHGDGSIDLAYPEGGSALMIQTVEHLTDVRVDHFAIIDWAGFRSLTDALGGVTVKVPVTTYDPPIHVTWAAGAQHFNGTQALQYITDRRGPPRGDIGVEQRQQDYLRAVFQQLHRTGTLANPLGASSVMHALTAAVSVDSTLSVTAMLHLALGLRGLNTGGIVFATAPYLATSTAGGQSTVRLNQAMGRGFWHAFEYDSLPEYLKKHGLNRFGASTP